jgi:hypothetical protein
VASEELIAHGREGMAAYNYPRIVEIIDELPRRRPARFCAVSYGTGRRLTGVHRQP